MDFLYVPFSYVMKACVWISQNSYFFGLFFFALAFEIILLPLAIKQQKSQIAMAKIRPKDYAIRKKYAGRTDRVTQQKMQMEINEMHQQEGVSPFSGCLPLLITLPIVFILFAIVREPVTYSSNFTQDATTHIQVTVEEEHPEYKVVAYVNTSAAVKALTDVVVTSSNARQVVDSFPKDEKILFAPDKNLGGYLNAITGRNMLLWNGGCHVHERFSIEKIVELKAQYPDAKVLAHPECKSGVLALADYVGSTAAILKFAQTDASTTYLVVTESGILHEMQKSMPNKQFIPVPPEIAMGAGCSCNECDYMRMNTMEKLYNCLKYEWPEVSLDETLREDALRPIERMLEISAQMK